VAPRRPRKPKYANPAEQARGEGWKPGAVLYGGPITVNGQRLDGPRLALITAIGEERIIARTKAPSDDEWSSESFLHFTRRKWRLATQTEWPA
jgi:hypothetical protein